MIWILLAVNLISWVFYSKYQFIERDQQSKKANKAWHAWGAINRLSVFGFIYVLSPFKDLLIAGLVYYILFDLLINKIALNKPISYIGQTAKTDILAEKIFKNGYYYLAAKLIAVLLIYFIL